MKLSKFIHSHAIVKVICAQAKRNYFIRFFILCFLLIFLYSFSFHLKTSLLYSYFIICNMYIANFKFFKLFCNSMTIVYTLFFSQLKKHSNEMNFFLLFFVISVFQEIIIQKMISFESGNSCIDYSISITPTRLFIFMYTIIQFFGYWAVKIAN